MDVEVDKDAHFPLVLVEGQVLVFSGNLLKYIDLFKGTYAMGFRSFHESKDFQLRYNLWRVVLSYLAEYDKTGSTHDNSWARTFGQVSQLERYEMVRLLNYYGIPLLMDQLLTWAIEQLLVMPRLSLQLSHPLVEWRLPLPHFKSWDKRALTMDSPYARINKAYALRRHEIMAICQTYIKTMDILVIIERDFLPPISANILAVNEGQTSLLISTSWGIAAFGDNEAGQLGTGIHNKNWMTLGHQRQRAQEYGLTVEETERWRAQRLTLGDWLPMNLRPEFSIISVATGDKHTIVNTTHGIYGCGNNDYGALGVPVVWDRYPKGQLPPNIYYIPIPLDVQNVLLVGCGYEYSLIYTKDGLFAAGSNARGPLGIKGSDYEMEGFVKVPFDEPLSALVCAHSVSFLLSRANRVYMAGLFTTGQANRKDLFTHIVTETSIIAIAASPEHALFLDEHGDVYMYQPILNEDSDEDTVSLDEDVEPVHKLSKISKLPPITHIVALPDGASCCIDNEGTAYVLESPKHDSMPLRMHIPHKVITMTRVVNDYYFVTCDGLFKWRNGDLYNFHPVPVVLSDLQLCIAPLPTTTTTGTTTTTTQEKYHFACHQCGENNYASLSYHTESHRVFCHTKTCLSDYKDFRLR